MISVIQLGTVDYATGLRLQQQLVALRKEEKIGDVLLLLEHSPAITLGRNAKAANVVASPETLKQRGVQLFECDRGGDVTFHGPGQIVGYPIFDLRGYARVGNESVGTGTVARPVERSSTSSKYLGAVDFVRRLEEVLIRTCIDFRIAAKRVPGLTGVWTDPESAKTHVGADPLVRPVEQCSTDDARISTKSEEENNREGHNVNRAKNSHEREAASAEVLSWRTADTNQEAKLAAIGVHISRFVTSHGFALNVNTDLSYFNLIIPCGITTKPVTSMQKELGSALDLNAVAESVSRNVGVIFQSQMLWVDTLDALLGRKVGVPMEPPAELRKIRNEDDVTWA